jgi:hypothetical protein
MFTIYNYENSSYTLDNNTFRMTIEEYGEELIVNDPIVIAQVLTLGAKV